MTTCPKCSYRRSPTDQAPAWQCPNCQVAYNKVTPEALAAREAALRDRQRQAETAPTPIWRSLGPVMVAIGVVVLLAAAAWKWNGRESSSPGQALARRFDAAHAAYLEQNYEVAQPEFEAMAREGDAKAQYFAGMLATRYASGPGAPFVDNESVEKWLLRSAEQGFVPAQAALGEMYQYGRSLAPNRDRAFHWREQAADNGDMDSQFELGQMIEQGKDGTSYTAAGIWYRRAAEQGHGDAQYKLGVLYDRGLLVTSRPSTGIELMLLGSTSNRRLNRPGLTYLVDREIDAMVSRLPDREELTVRRFAIDWKPGDLLPR